MVFFETLNTMKIVGLLLLLCGALLCFLSKRMTAKAGGKHTEVIVKTGGLGIAIFGACLVFLG